MATVEQLAEYFTVPVSTVYAWNTKRTGPKFVKIGRHVRYLWADVDAWAEQHHPFR